MAWITCKWCGTGAEKRYQTSKFCSRECNVASWRFHNRERMLESMRQYSINYDRTASPNYKEYLVRQRLRYKKYYEDDKDSYIRRAGKRRALLKKAFVEDVVPLVVLERDDGICGLCKEDVDPFNYHIDHIKPISLGGEHSYANVQVAHPKCNYSKGNRYVD